MQTALLLLIAVTSVVTAQIIPPYPECKCDPGPKGDNGVAGATGPVGTPGKDGTKGEKGDPGIPGHPGANGKDGVHGTPGLHGSIGSAGSKGDKGDPGMDGSKGDKGEPGPAGSNANVKNLETAYSTLKSTVDQLHKSVEDLTKQLNSLLPSKTNTYFYNYNDEIATAYCTSIYNDSGATWAVRRDFMNEANCKTICHQLTEKIQNKLKLEANYPHVTSETGECFGSLKIYKDQQGLQPNPTMNNQPDSQTLGLMTFAYTTLTGCYVGKGHGPNYCCCRAIP